MIAIDGQTFRENVSNAWSVFRLDEKAVDNFTVTRAAVIQSFWVAVILFPIYILDTQSQIAALPPLVSLPRAYLDASLVYVILWLLFPVVMVPITQGLGVFDRYPRFLIVHNWVGLFIPLAVFALRLVGWSGLLPVGALGSVIFAAYIYSIFLTWFVLRHTLRVTSGRAIALAFIAIALGATVQLAFLRGTGMDAELFERAMQNAMTQTQQSGG